MPTSEAFVTTDKAPQYVAQLCNHFTREAKRRPGLVQTKIHDDGGGVADFGTATCSMQARPEGLALTIAATDAANLDFIQHIVGSHLERFGRRDGLRVRWEPIRR